MAIGLHSRLEENQFEDAYCREVRSRTKWSYRSIGARYREFIPRAIAAAKECDASVTEFVVAQFDQLPEHICRNLWRKPFPLLHAFTTEGAQNRYHRYKCERMRSSIVEEGFVSRVISKIASSKQIWGNDSHDEGWVIMAITNGTLSIWYLAVRKMVGHCTLDLPRFMEKDINDCIETIETKLLSGDVDAIKKAYLGD